MRAVVVLGDTAPPAQLRHDTLAADALQVAGKAQAKLSERCAVVPNPSERVCRDAAEDEVRFVTAYPAERVVAIPQHPKDTENIADAPPPRRGELRQGVKRKGAVKVKAD